MSEKVRFLDFVRKNARIWAKLAYLAIFGFIFKGENGKNFTTIFCTPGTRFLHTARRSKAKASTLVEVDNEVKVCRTNI